MNKKGITLIELIVFIIVGGIFIPLAYIVFTSVVKDSARPERAETVKTIAEAKVGDIISMGFGSPPVQNFNYRDVRGDVTNPGGRFSDLSYDGYQWKWTYEFVVYRDNDSRSITTITKTPSRWSTIERPTGTGNGRVYVGDYIEPDISNDHFYRAHFLKWQSSKLYNTYDYVVPDLSTYNLPFQASPGGTSSTGQPSGWESAVASTPPYQDGGVTWMLILTPLSPSGWLASYPYSSGSEIVEASKYYQSTGVGTSGLTEPSPWPVSGTIYDGLLWQSITMVPTLTLQKGSLPPSLWPMSGEYNDTANGNQIRWIESNVYRRITIVVRPPNCTTTSCEYSVSTILTSRTAL
jgi:hypothetical protein